MTELIYPSRIYNKKVIKSEFMAVMSRQFSWSKIRRICIVGGGN